MKLSHLFDTLPKRFGSAAIVALAIALPAIGLAADTVQIEGALGVANVTAGDTTYKSAVNATYDQVVKYEVYYHNRELPDSGKIAQNLNVKISLPTAAGKTQNATATIKADNSNTITDSATVNLDRADASLQYIPGSAVWKHNIGTNAAVNYQETKISDAVVTSGQGLTLENEKPCYNFSATVTVLARVMVPGVSIVKQVEKKGETNKWATSNTANPGDTLKYLITYKNTGNSIQNQVVLRDNLPPKMTLVPGTTSLADASHPSGVAVADTVTQGGINAGNFGAGANAFVTFEVTVPAADQLACGVTEFRNVGVVRPQDMNEYYNTAITTVNKVCAPVTPQTPVFSCTGFDFTQGDNRSITVSKFTTAQQNATFKNVVIDWGDSTDALTTNTPVGKSHTFAKDGTFTVNATAHFDVAGTDKAAPVGVCSKSVAFTAPGVTPTTTELVNTGPGQVVGMFAAFTAIGAIAHRSFLARRLTR
jgi:uncharacterized repeat protein (TIGR01451 family)